MSENNPTPFEANNNAMNPQGSSYPGTDAWGATSQTPHAHAQTPYAQPAPADSNLQAPYQSGGGGALPSYPSGANPYATGAEYGYAGATGAYGTPAYGANAYGEPPLNQPWYGIDFVNAIKRFFLKYATFSGRASRGEFWWAWLGCILVGFALGFVSIIPIIGTIVSALIMISIILPFIAVSVRRLHDANLSGWFLLIPYALSGIASVSVIAGFAPMFAEFAQNIDNIDALSEAELVELASPALAGAGTGFLFGTIGLIIFIVLLARKSNPAGARFDK